MIGLKVLPVVSFAVAGNPFPRERLAFRSGSFQKPAFFDLRVERNKTDLLLASADEETGLSASTGLQSKGTVR